VASKLAKALHDNLRVDNKLGRLYKCWTNLAQTKQEKVVLPGATWFWTFQAGLFLTFLLANCSRKQHSGPEF